MSNLRELFEFRNDTIESVVRYTSRGDGIIYGGHVWSSTQIRRDRINRSGEINKNGLELFFPLGHPFAMDYLGYGPDGVTLATVWRSEPANDNSFYPIFKGRITDVGVDEDEVRITLQDIFTTSLVTGLHERMHGYCRHVVYDSAGCKLNREDFAVATVPTAIDSTYSVITCPEAAAFPNGYFSGGMLRTPNGRMRYISKHAGNQITLWRPEPTVSDMLTNAGWGQAWGQYFGGVGVTIYPGCDGSLKTCDERFDNLDNNGGFYFQRRGNPFSGDSVF
jgi:Phage conserved hypothetical protein BR0599.